MCKTTRGRCPRLIYLAPSGKAGTKKCYPDLNHARSRPPQFQAVRGCVRSTALIVDVDAFLLVWFDRSQPQAVAHVRQVPPRQDADRDGKSRPFSDRHGIWGGRCFRSLAPCQLVWQEPEFDRLRPQASPHSLSSPTRRLRRRVGEERGFTRWPFLSLSN